MEENFADGKRSSVPTVATSAPFDFANIQVYDARGRRPRSKFWFLARDTQESKGSAGPGFVGGTAHIGAIVQASR